MKIKRWTRGAAPAWDGNCPATCNISCWGIAFSIHTVFLLQSKKNSQAYRSSREMNIFSVWQGWTVSGPVKLHTNTVNACALQSFSLNPIYYLPESFIFIATLVSWHFTTGLWIDHAYRTLQSNLTGTKMGVELPSFKCNIKSIAAVKEIERYRRSRENRMMKWTCEFWQL